MPLRKNLRKIRERYEKTAGGGSPPTVFPIVADLIGDIEGKIVLDLGCSRGDFEFEYLLKKNPNIIVGVDFSFKAIKLANERISSGENVVFLVGDAMTLPLKDQKFDKIVITEVIEHLPNVDDCLRELKRTLKDEGEIVLSTPNYFNVAGIFKKVIDRCYYHGEERWSYAGTEELERFFTPFNLRGVFRAHGLKILNHTGSEIFLSLRPLLLIPLTMVDQILVSVLSRFDKTISTKFPLKYFGVVQYFRLKKNERLE